MGSRVLGAVVKDHVHMGRGARSHPDRIGFAWPAEKTLGELLGVSERQVRRYVVELEQAGFLRVTPRMVGLANGLELMWPPIIGRTDSSGRRSAAKAQRSIASGQFVSQAADKVVRVDRTNLSCDLLDLPEDHLEARNMQRRVRAAGFAAIGDALPVRRRAS